MGFAMIRPANYRSAVRVTTGTTCQRALRVVVRGALQAALRAAFRIAFQATARVLASAAGLVAKHPDGSGLPVPGTGVVGNPELRAPADRSRRLRFAGHGPPRELLNPGLRACLAVGLRRMVLPAAWQTANDLRTQALWRMAAVVAWLDSGGPTAIIRSSCGHFGSKRNEETRGSESCPCSA
jgi:hypothetical protein